MAETQYYEGVGRRKTASARVRLHTGSQGFVVNDKPFEEFFTREVDQYTIRKVFEVTDTENRFGITIRVAGGGVTGQAGAVRLGIARALLKVDPDYRQTLRANGMLTRDPRAKERKKPGLKRARKAPQYTKR